MTPAELRSSFLAYCQERGFTAAEVRRLGWQSFSAAEAAKRWPALPSTRLRDGFVIPYCTLAGRQNGFVRWRNLDLKVKGFAALTEADGPARYLQPIDTAPELYFSRVPRELSWKSIAEDASQFVLITEGEGKSACTTKFGFPCIGLGGVWNFRATKMGCRLLPEFAAWKWGGRKVYVVVDSDAESNGNVRLAQNLLCEELVSLNAEVYPVRLPKLGGKKTGLDDYLLAAGPEALRALLKATPEWAESAALAAMNKEAIFVNGLAAILMFKHDHFFSREKFCFSNANRYYDLAIEVKNEKTGKTDSKLVKKKLAPEWIAWEGRRECERVVFDPTGAAKKVNDRGEYNLFGGLAVDAAPGDIAPWKRLLDWLFTADEEEARRWFTCWLAYPLQAIADHAEPKMQSCAALVSKEQGTGKGLIVAPIGALYGAHFRAITPRELRSEFNEWARNLLFMQGNEITGKDCRDFADDLKALITEPQFWMREMYTPRYQLANHINSYFTSNHDDAFFLDFTDRRFFVHRAPERKLIAAEDAGWGRSGIDAYLEWMRQPASLRALLHYLLHVRLGAWDHRRPPETVAKLEQQIESANQAALWARAAKENPKQYLKTAELRRWKGTDGKEHSEFVDLDLSERRLWMAEELLKLSGLAAKGYTARAMGQALRATGWLHVRRGQQIRYLHGEVKKAPLWSRHAEEVAELAERELARKYNEERCKAALP